MSRYRLVNIWAFVPGDDNAIDPSVQEVLNAIGDAYRTLRRDPEGYIYYTPYGSDFDNAVAEAEERVESTDEPWLIVIVTNSTVHERLEIMNRLDYLTHECGAFVVVVPLANHVSADMVSLLSEDPADPTPVFGVDVINKDGLKSPQRALARVGRWAERRSD